MLRIGHRGVVWFCLAILLAASGCGGGGRSRGGTEDTDTGHDGDVADAAAGDAAAGDAGDVDDESDVDDTGDTGADTFWEFTAEPPRNPCLGNHPSDNPTGGLVLPSGEFRVTRFDMQVRGRSLRFAFVRTWRSSNRRMGPLGRGWDATFFARLEEDGRDLVFHDGAGRSLRFEGDGEAYRSPRGIYSRLRATESGWILRGRGGARQIFDEEGRLVAFEDRTGAEITLQYDGAVLESVRDEYGREYLFAFDDDGRLQSIADFTGREVHFTYAGEELVEVRGPAVTGTPHANDFPNGTREQYAYEDGLLTAVVAPNEVEDGSLVPYIQNTWDAEGRVVEHVVGGTNATGIAAGGTLYLNYERGLTSVSDRNGNVTAYHYDEHGQCTRVVEEPEGEAWTTNMTYNDDGEVTELVRPMGNRVVYEFDAENPDRFQQGNLLSIMRIPDSRGGAQDQLVETFAYEPLFNQILTHTDARGNEPDYVPPNGGAWSAERYTSTWTYDYMEADAPPAEAVEWDIDVPAELLGQGDVNDDGAVDLAMGLPVRRSLPTVALLPDSHQSEDDGDTAQEIVERYQYNEFGQLVAAIDPRGNVRTAAYYPENDPDGDGEDLIAGGDPETGGYLAEVVEDAMDRDDRQDEMPPTALATTFELDRRGNVIALTNAGGSTWTMVVDQLDQVVELEAPTVDPTQERGYLRRFTRDANGAVVARHIENVTTDPETHLPVAGTPRWFVHESTYDILGQRVTTTVDATRDLEIDTSDEPELLVTTVTYDGNGNPTSRSRPEGDVAVFGWDARDLLVSAELGAGGASSSVTSYGYDDNGNLVSETDAADHDGDELGETSWQVFDGFDRVVEVRDRADNQGFLTIDPAGRVVRNEWYGPSTATGGSELLAATEMLHDELGRPFQLDVELFVPEDTIVQSNATVGDGPLTAGDDLLTTTMEYDANSRRTYRTTDDGQTSRWSYDGANRLIASRTPMIDEVSPGGPFWTEQRRTLDDNGNVVARTVVEVMSNGFAPPLETQYVTVFDALDRPVRFSNAAGETTYVEYDSRSNVVSSYDSRSEAMADPLGLVPGLINDRGNARRYFFDGIGRRWLDRREVTSTGRGDGPLDVENPFIPGGVIDLNTVWDGNSRVVERRDGNGHATQWSHDALDRVVEQVNADGGTRTVSWDADSNPIEVEDENGSVHSLAYDPLGNLIEHSIVPSDRTIEEGVPMLVGTNHQTFVYDGLSRLVNATDENDPSTPSDDWTVELSWDSASRVVEERQNGVPVGSSWSGTHRSQIHFPGEETVSVLTYGPLNRVTDQSLVSLDREEPMSLSTWYTGCCCREPAVTWDMDGDEYVDQIQEVLFGADMRVSRILAGIVETPLLALDIDRDTDGGILTVTGWSGTPGTDETGPVGLEITQDRASTGWLTQIDQLFGVDDSWEANQLDLSHGPAGELLDVDTRAREAILRTYGPTYERMDSPYEYNGGDAGTGLRTRDEDFVYQWDALGRLRVVRLASDPDTVIATYLYDATPFVFGGRRVEKTVSNSGPLDGTTRFFYDGARVIEERAVAESVETTVRQFLYGGRVDQIQAMYADSDGDGELDEVYAYYLDWNGNVAMVVDETGLPVEHYLYPLYAEPVILDDATLTAQPFSAVGNPFLFTGRRWEPEIGKYYFRARYMDPVDMEFLSRDPTGAWGDPASFGNPVAYAGNDPLGRLDPFGLRLTDAELQELDEQLREYKEYGDEILEQVARGELAMVEGMRLILARIAQDFIDVGLCDNDDEERFVEIATIVLGGVRDVDSELSNLIPGQPGSAVEIERLTPEQMGSYCVSWPEGVNPADLDNRGFRDLVEDRSNFFQHFAGYFYFGYYYGQIPGTVAAFSREIISQDGQWEDYSMGWRAARMGSGLSGLGYGLSDFVSSDPDTNPILEDFWDGTTPLVPPSGSVSFGEEVTIRAFHHTTQGQGGTVAPGAPRGVPNVTPSNPIQRGATATMDLVGGVLDGDADKAARGLSGLMGLFGGN